MFVVTNRLKLSYNFVATKPTVATLCMNGKYSECFLVLFGVEFTKFLKNHTLRLHDFCTVLACILLIRL